MTDFAWITTCLKRMACDECYIWGTLINLHNIFKEAYVDEASTN
jgi:hypothetical protein